MTYKRGNVKISVYQLDGFGKNPSLWIGTENSNTVIKVASFSSEDKANQFCKWIECMLGHDNKKLGVKYE